MCKEGRIHKIPHLEEAIVTGYGWEQFNMWALLVHTAALGG